MQRVKEGYGKLTKKDVVFLYIHIDDRLLPLGRSSFNHLSSRCFLFLCLLDRTAASFLIALGGILRSSRPTSSFLHSGTDPSGRFPFGLRSSVYVVFFVVCRRFGFLGNRLPGFGWFPKLIA